MKLRIVLAMILLVLLVIYFYIYFPYCNCRYTLDELQKYFAILNTFTTLLIGFLGLIVGIYYYYDKESRRPKLKFLLDELNSYDQLLIDLFNMTFMNQKELDILRGKISRGFEMIVLILEAGYSALKFSKDDTRAILRVNSFVDNSEVMMRTPFDLLNEINLLEKQDTCIELIKSAKWVCMKHSR
jgi:hypothetical protein